MRKFFSLESELAAFKGNYKSNKTFVSDNLAGQKAQLQSQQVSLDKLEDKSIKLSKDFDKFKRKLNTNNRSVESAITGELTPIQLNLTEQSPKSYADMAKQSGIEIQSTIENKIVEDTTAQIQ